ESTLPGVVAQHDERIAAAWRIGGREEASGGRSRADDAEEVFRDELGPDHVPGHGPGRLRDGQCDRHARDRGESVKNQTPIPEVQKVVIRDGANLSGALI